MKLRKTILKVMEVVTAHYDDIADNCYGVSCVAFMYKELSSKTIWGGNGDRDEYMYIVVTEQGWKEIIVETETGNYQKGDGVMGKTVNELSIESLENYINGVECTISEVEMFLRKFNSLKKEYSEDFKLFFE